MIGGQHHHIVDPVAVEAGEEFAEDTIERQHLDAHLAAAGAEGVADIIGGREADGEEVGRLALAEMHVVAHARGEGEDRGVEFGRGAKRVPVARGAGEASGADRLGPPRHRDRRGCASSQTSGSGIASRAWASASAMRALTAVDRPRRGDAGTADEGVAVPPPALVGRVAAHHDRGAVLAGDRDDAAARVGAVHEVAERRHAQMQVGDGVMVGRAAGDALVLRAIDIFVGRARRPGRTNCWR